MFVTSFAFFVITFGPIEVQTFSAPQNDRQNLVFVKDIEVVVEKMTKNRRKVIGKPGDSLLCCLHSTQFWALVFSFLYAQDLLRELMSDALKNQTNPGIKTLCAWFNF